MILLTTIQKKLSKHISSNVLRYEFDIRYLDKWLRDYPEAFPKFVRENKYKTIFNNEKLRYEFHRI